jgi:hypothetical protein
LCSEHIELGLPAQMPYLDSGAEPGLFGEGFEGQGTLTAAAELATEMKATVGMATQLLAEPGRVGVGSEVLSAVWPMGDHIWGRTDRRRVSSCYTARHDSSIPNLLRSSLGFHYRLVQT